MYLNRSIPNLKKNVADELDSKFNSKSILFYSHRNFFIFIWCVNCLCMCWFPCQASGGNATSAVEMLLPHPDALQAWATRHFHPADSTPVSSSASGMDICWCCGFGMRICVLGANFFFHIQMDFIMAGCLFYCISQMASDCRQASKREWETERDLPCTSNLMQGKADSGSLSRCAVPIW